MEIQSRQTEIILQTREPLGEIRQAINQVYHLSHTDLGRIEGLDAYLRYRFVINKDSTGMNMASHQLR